MYFNYPLYFLSTMQRRDINLVKSNQKNTSTRQVHPAAAILAGVFALILIGGIVWGAKAMLGSSSPVSGKILTEKKFSLLESVKKFFSFDSEPVLDGEDKAEDRINLLLLGMGGPGHDGPYLSDTIILASIKPSTNEVALVSIPRDLQARSEFGYTKINAVHANYEYKHRGEGAEYTRRWFEKQFDLKIPYYVRVDFKAFVEAINAVGGVTVDVSRTFTDNYYPNAGKERGPDCTGENTSSPCRYLKIHFDAGTQTMDGERALIFARSRKGVGDSNDYGRSNRQQLVMVALKDKLLSLGTLANPLKLQQLHNSLTTNIKTNLDWKELLRLSSLARNVDRTAIKNLVLEEPKLGFMVNANNRLGSVVVPAKGGFDEINKAIKYIFEPSANAFLNPVSPTSTLSRPLTDSGTTSSALSVNIEIQNGTWQAGLGARAKKQLETKGFKIMSVVGNSVQRPIKNTNIYIITQKITADRLTALGTELNAQISDSLPSWLKTTPNTTSTPYQKDTDVLIIIGNNFRPS